MSLKPFLPPRDEVLATSEAEARSRHEARNVLIRRRVYAAILSARSFEEAKPALLAIASDLLR